MILRASKNKQLGRTTLRIEAMSTTSSSFDVYMSEFVSTTEQIKSRIQSKNDNAAEEIDEMFQQGEDLLKQMGLEARGIDDIAVKRNLLAKVR